MNKLTITLILGLALTFAFAGCGSATPAANNANSPTPLAQLATPTPAPISEPTNAPAAADSNAAIPLLERLLPDPTSRAFRYAGADFVIQEASITRIHSRATNAADRVPPTATPTTKRNAIWARLKSSPKKISGTKSPEIFFCDCAGKPSPL